MRISDWSADVCSSDLVGDAAFDLALAVDSLPYLMQAGTALVQRHFAEIARVLRTGGDLLIFNFSYRDDIEADRRDLAGLAHAFGFAVLRDGTRDLALWDASPFHLTRRSGAWGRRGRTEERRVGKSGGRTGD